MMSHVYRVGEVYHPGKTRWQIGTDFNYRSGMLELRLFLSRLTSADIESIRNGSCIFHIAEVHGILFFLFEFGRAVPLSDNSYTYWLVGEKERTVPPRLAPGETIPLTIILVSSEDGTIRALRRIALAHDFSVKLFDIIRTQTTQHFDPTLHDRHIAETYEKYPTSQALRSIAIATCVVAPYESSN